MTAPLTRKVRLPPDHHGLAVSFIREFIGIQIRFRSSSRGWPRLFAIPPEVFLTDSTYLSQPENAKSSIWLHTAHMITASTPLYSHPATRTGSGISLDGPQRFVFLFDAVFDAQSVRFARFAFMIWSVAGHASFCVALVTPANVRHLGLSIEFQASISI
jgi:hypothetical protein